MFEQKQRFSLQQSVAWWSNNGHFNWDLYLKILEYRFKTS